MEKNKNFYQSFSYALSGLFQALKKERNLRFHLSAASGVTLFAVFYGLSSIEWAVLTLVFGLVISCELINTAIENAVDTATEEYSPFAKAAKDTAAAAVLASAIVSLIVGVFIFFDIEKLAAAFHLITSSVLHIVLFAAAIIINIVFLTLYKERK